MPENENPKLYTGTSIEPPTRVEFAEHAYAELDVTTNFSFLHGASHPDELVYTAALQGYRAMAITDINTLAGVVRAYDAARKIEGFRLIIGTRLVFADGSPSLLVWPTNKAGYTQLCRLLTLGRRRAPKGECELHWRDFLDHSEGLHAAVCGMDEFGGTDLRSVSGNSWILSHGPEVRATKEPFAPKLHELREAMGDRASLALSLARGEDDATALEHAMQMSRETMLPLLATNHVHYHDPGRRALQDVLTCVRHGCRVAEAGYKLFANAERYLKQPALMHRLFHKCPAAIERGLEISSACRFSLEELRYDYPTEAVPLGRVPSSYLRELTYVGAREKYPNGIPIAVMETIEKELNFICNSKYESYFLTVRDLVHFAKGRGILCQGRGSAANSAVCYCLGVTAVDPDKFQLVFERFASDARNEPPDIDLDFEHERREEVIQYVYEKYGREKSAMTASLITYRGRSAIRDVGKVLGFTEDILTELSGKLDWWHKGTLTHVQLAEAKINPNDPAILRLIWLTSQLLGFPRHLSQHVGGMVISHRAVCDFCPIENAAMEDRTVIEWDKDDLDALKIFKVDILALGMLTCISKSLAMLRENALANFELRTVPQEDAEVYTMISDADTIGVFQVESRAQMSMLPRLRPREFYDLVIEVAIVRPGPIQGDMVHPYLTRREALAADPNYVVQFPKEELRGVLGKTLGVPLFQEQVMSLSMVAAGFTGAEADMLRRAMAAWKRGGGIEPFRDKFINGMTSRGYEDDFAQRCFKQICGFGEYGFPESHAASFAKLVYISAWLKRFHPAAFCAGLLNSQPMGFYAPAQLVSDARNHGVIVRPIDVNHSDWDCTLELDDCSEASSRRGTDKTTWGNHGPAVRLGMRMIKGMREADAQRITLARMRGVFANVEELQERAMLDAAVVKRLAVADALGGIVQNRREGSWEALALDNSEAPLFELGLPHGGVPKCGTQIELPKMPEREETVLDYATTGLSLKKHPVFFAREQLAAMRCVTAKEIESVSKFRNGRLVNLAGLVLLRQRPGTASGVVFMTLEDETGTINLVIWSHVYEKFRLAARHSMLLMVNGFIQRESQVLHVIAKKLTDQSHLLRGVRQASRDFH